MSGSLASLVVDLQLNSASLREGLDAARGKVAGFAASVNQAFASVSDVAKGVKRAANEIAQAGLGLAAVAGGAVALAATVDKGIAAEVKNLKNSFADLAVPVAQLVVPAMRELAENVRAVADFVASLSPHTKEMIGDFLKVTAVIGGTALVVSRIAAAISALTGVIAAVTSGPFLALAAGIAVALGLTVALHAAWRTNWNGMRDVVKAVATNVRGYISQAFEAARSIVGDFVNWAADGLLLLVGVAEALAKVLGVNVSKATDFGKELALWAKHLTTVEGFGELIDDAEETVGVMKDGLAEAAKGFGKELQLIMKELGLDKLFGGFRAGAADRHDLTKAAAAAPIDHGLENKADLFAQGAIKGAGKEAADALSAVGEKFLQGGIEGAAEVAAAATRLADAMAVGGRIVVNKLGDVGQIINSAIQGFQTAGPWGAIIAVIAEVVTRLEGFTKFADMLNAKLFKSLGELNTMLAPVFDLLMQLSETLNPIRQIIHTVIEVVLNLLGPAFKIVGGLLKGLGEVLAPIADSISALGDVIMVIVNLLNNMTPVMESLRIVFALVGAAINFAALGIMGTASNLLATVRDIMKALGLNTDAVTKTLNEITLKAVMMAAKQKEFDLFAAPPLGELSKQAEKAADAATKVTESFNEMVHNLPNVYHGLKAAQWNASGGGPASGGSNSSGGAAGGISFAGVGFDPGNILGGADYAGVFQGADGSAGSVGANVVPFLGGATALPWVDTTNIDVGEQGMGEDLAGIGGAGVININIENVSVTDPMDFYKQMKAIAKTEQSRKSRTSNSPLP